jgi:peroxin-3
MPLMNYLYERRRGLAKTAGVLGGVYFASSYAAARLQDMREAMVEERNAKDKCAHLFS